MGTASDHGAGERHGSYFSGPDRGAEGSVQSCLDRTQGRGGNLSSSSDGAWFPWNRTNRPRRAMVINVVRDGVHSATDEPLLDGVPTIGKGKALDGQFFPLLYDPAHS